MNSYNQIMVLDPCGRPEGFDEKKQFVLETIRTTTPASLEELRAILGYIKPEDRAVMDAVFEDGEGWQSEGGGELAEAVCGVRHAG